MHKQGVSWAEIGAHVGQRNLAVTANVYTHVMLGDDGREIDRAKLLARVTRARTVSSPVSPRDTENPALAGRF